MADIELPSGEHDLGSGFSYSFFGAGQGKHRVKRAGVIIFHEGEGGVAGPWFDTPRVRAIPWSQERKFWRVVSLNPLHLEPSIQMYRMRGKGRRARLVPSHHGFIRNGRWISA